ncbi:MAG: radical SAM protein [Pseudomonadota bacterium]
MLDTETCQIKPAGRHFTGSDQRAPLRDGLTNAGQMGPTQTAGRFYPIACVALEITQRCNLDCTLCYLSDKAESAFDVPLVVLKRRIQMIYDHYGPGTSVQITGGDPTLRKTTDVAELCRFIRSLGMRSCLMTNGIRAKREMLAELADAGLNDVAFHVDLTQERKGFATEADLNAVRADYIDRAKDLGLRILFNTTVYDGNLAQIPDIARFFRDHPEHLTLVSFQLQADTGRGVLRARDDEVSQASVMAAISRGIAALIDFDTVRVGHSDCNRYASMVIAGGKAISALGNQGLVADLIGELEHHETRLDGHLDIAPTLWRVIRRKPWLALRAARHMLSLAWQLRRGLVRTKGRASRLAILVHNFMDGKKLDSERCQSCVFMVATEDGPLSMCAHNAKRDDYLFQPARVETDGKTQWWSAATDRMTNKPVHADAAPTPRKLLKGRMKAAVVKQTSRT